MNSCKQKTLSNLIKQRFFILNVRINAELLTPYFFVLVGHDYVCDRK